MNHAVVEVVGLTKVFGGKTITRAVDDLSFVLDRGEILGLLGPNGAGKTTTIQMLLSTLRPTSGRILYFGRSIEEERSEILRQVGYASAYSRLPRRLTIRENLDIFGRLHGLERRDRAARIEQLLRRFGVWDLRSRLMEGLSAGQTTRVTLAKAFLARPRVVLLDEPTASLDPDIAVEAREFILQQREESQVSIIFTSHNMEEVARVCDRVIFLDKGKIARSGSPEQLARSAATTHLSLHVTGGLELALAQAREMQLTARAHDTTLDVEIDDHQLAPFLAALARHNVDYDQFHLEKPTLEDYFLKLARTTARTPP